MRKVFCFLALIVLTCSLSAQVGLFDLEYGDTWDNCDAVLYDIGFSYIDINDDGGDLYYPFEDVPELNNVDQLVLYFEGGEDELTGWAIFYIPSDEFKPEIEVVKQLEALHGKATYHSDEDYYSWELGYGRFVEAGATNSGELFYAEYGTEF